MGLKEVVIAKKELLSEEIDNEQLSEIEDNIAMARRLISPVAAIEHPSNLMINCMDIFGDNKFFVEWY
jgi:hypothetical protein